MTDGQTFLLVFIAIYLSDCLVWLPASGYAVIAYSRRRFVVRRSAVFFEALRKGFVVLQPLPPFGAVFAGQAWPVSMDSSGLAPFSRENPNPGPEIPRLPWAVPLRWEEIQSISVDGVRLIVNGHHYAEGATAAGALMLARALKIIKSRKSNEDREAAIDALQRRFFNVNRASKKARLFLRAVRGMRLNATVLFVAVFLFVPYAYWRFEDEPPFFFAVAATWLLMIQIVVEFWVLHRRFFPALSAERWTHAILAALFPHYALRSIDVLSRGFLADSHPLAVMMALAKPDEIRNFADRLLRDARNPIPRSASSKGENIAETFRVRFFLPALEYLERSEACLSAPIEGGIDEAGVLSECPRCRVPHTRLHSTCADCGGIPTVPLQASA